MIRKKLQDCKYFFLDSGVIIDLLKVDLNGSSHETVSKMGYDKKRAK